MCLEYQLPKNSKQNIIDSITPKKGLKVYKVVHLIDGKYYPLYRCTHTPYEKGVNEAIRTPVNDWTGKKYTTGFHFYKNKRDAQNAYETELKSIYVAFVIIECIVKKSWITNVGIESWYSDTHLGLHECTVIVAKKAIFPTFAENEYEI